MQIKAWWGIRRESQKSRKHCSAQSLCWDLSTNSPLGLAYICTPPVNSSILYMCLDKNTFLHLSSSHIPSHFFWFLCSSDFPTLIHQPASSKANNFAPLSSWQAGFFFLRVILCSLDHSSSFSSLSSVHFLLAVALYDRAGDQGGMGEDWYHRRW